ncbi:hypothetical protein TNCV_4687991 [Trichonephila clavipes]|nr:hypothetical protein TNCV_4687991 [Trichonephila clavipes]
MKCEVKMQINGLEISDLRVSVLSNLTPLDHADASRDVLPRGGTSQWHPTRYNPPTGQNGFFRPTREASKMDCTDFSAFNVFKSGLATLF